MGLWGDTKIQQEAKHSCKVQFKIIVRVLKEETPGMFNIYGMEDFLWTVYERAFIDGITEACQQIKSSFETIETSEELESYFDLT